MNVMEFAKEKERKAQRREDLCGAMMIIGLILAGVGLVAMLRGLHPVNVAIFVAGTSLLEAGALLPKRWRR